MGSGLGQPPGFAQELEGADEVGRIGIRGRFQDAYPIGPGEIRQGWKIDVAAGGCEVVLAGGEDVVDVYAGDMGGEAAEPSGGVDEAEVFADLGVADVPPEAEAGNGESAHEGFGFEFGGEGFPGGEVFEGEGDAGFGGDGQEGVEALAEAIDLAGGFFVAEDLGLELEGFEGLGELLAAGGHGEEVEGVGGHIDVAGVADDDGGADFGGEAEGAGDMDDGEFAFAAVGGAGGIEFGVGAGGADGDGAEVVDAVDADGAGADHGLDAGDEFGAQVVTEFDAVEAEGEDFLDHGFAGEVAAGVPAGAEGEGPHFPAWAWMAVMATVLTISVTVQPRERSLTGLRRPCMTGPMATAPAERWTAL